MFQKLLAVTALFLTCALANAQCLPPALDAPLHWDIHGPDGSLGLSFDATYQFSDGNVDVYTLTIEFEVNGETVIQTSWAFQEWSEDGASCDVDVLNGDSGNWTEWHWQGDHFQKVGGTHHQRSYYPIY